MKKVLLKEINWVITQDYKCIPFVINKEGTAMKTLLDEKITEWRSSPFSRYTLYDTRRIKQSIFEGVKHLGVKAPIEIIFNNNIREKLIGVSLYHNTPSAFDLYYQYYACADSWVDKNIQKNIKAQCADVKRYYSDFIPDQLYLADKIDFNKYHTMRECILKTPAIADREIKHKYEEASLNKLQVKFLAFVLSKNYQKVQRKTKSLYKKLKDKELQDAASKQQLEDQTTNF
ncbi:MAG: hypothetical protein J6A28_04495 [Clostridia bacterium]|nr:hypothetical protein [Clostridia bacterium]